MASGKTRKREARLPGLAKMAAQGSLACAARPCRPSILDVIPSSFQ